MEKKDRITTARWDKDVWKYVKKKAERYKNSRAYNFNRFLNHIVRQQMNAEKQDKSERVYYLKMEILELAKQKEEITQQLKEKQIIYEAKRMGEDKEKTEKMMQGVRSPKKAPQIALE